MSTQHLGLSIANSPPSALDITVPAIGAIHLAAPRSV